MSSTYTSNDLVNAIAAASKNLSARKDEVNRLNVFPVPDGDTGTNMSLTLESVVASLAKLPIGASAAEIRKAITATPASSPRRSCAACAKAPTASTPSAPSPSSPPWPRPRTWRSTRCASPSRAPSSPC